MCATYPIKGDATKVRLNFRGLKLVIKPNLNKNSPISEWKRISTIFQESGDTKIYKSSPGFRSARLIQLKGPTLGSIYLGPKIGNKPSFDKKQSNFWKKC